MLIAERPSPNFDARCDTAGRNVPVDMLILHYTGMGPAQRALDWLCDRQSKVSAHYLVDRAGRVTQLVPEDCRAWHAGIAWWRGHDDINARSIGIELANPGHDFGYEDFPDAQIAATIELAGAIVARHPIPPRNVTGHADVAPGRKIDPGERFPWQRLAAAGIGLWPDAGTLPGRLADEADIRDTLAAIGYPVAQAGLKACLDAFQRHFQPAAVTGPEITGQDDAETRRLAAALLVRLAGEPGLS